MMQVDVTIVGAGPTGLLTALELALGGARVLVLERLVEPSLVSKAFGVGPLGVEALQRRGMMGAIDAAEARSLVAMKAFMEQKGSPGSVERRSKYSGHFAGLMIRKDPQREPERRMRMVDQQAVEAMLMERVLAAGVVVRREHEVTVVSQDKDGVEVTWNGPAGRGRTRCAYLVGCDGGRSTIRKMAGFAFPGTPQTMTMYTAICDLDHPERLGSAGFQYTSNGMYLHGPFPRRLALLDFSGPPQDRQAPVTREEIEAVLRHVSGEDVRVTRLDSAGRWADNTRLVDTYRLGRVLLAGDAAHVHSPTGGQGMSLGLVDAANLGWKLAAVIRGDADDTLLDTYTAERRPVAEAVLANTLAQAAIMRPDPRSQALRALLGDLMGIDAVSRFLGEMMSGLSASYDLGTGDGGVGRLIADRQLPSGGGSLYALMQDGAGLLLDATPDGRASRLVSGATRRIRCVSVGTGPSLLIRPDGCVAWAGEGSNESGLEEAARRWFAAGPLNANRFAAA